jgi:hypothetical protein
MKQNKTKASALVIRHAVPAIFETSLSRPR